MARNIKRVTGAAAKRAAKVRTLQEQGAGPKEFRKVADCWLNRGNKSIQGFWKP